MRTVAACSLYRRHSSISVSGQSCTSSQRVHGTRCPWLHFVLPLPAHAARHKQTRRLSNMSCRALAFLRSLTSPARTPRPLSGQRRGFEAGLSLRASSVKRCDRLVDPVVNTSVATPSVAPGVSASPSLSSNLNESFSLTPSCGGRLQDAPRHELPACLSFCRSFFLHF